MILRRLFNATLPLVALVALVGAASRDTASTYETFVKAATAQRGLFTLWHKDGKLYVELRPNQLDRDFVQTIVPGSGVGGEGVVWGNTDHLPTELVRFERAGENVAIVWPSPYFVAPGSPEGERAIASSFSRSIVGLAPIVATDSKTRDIIVDAAPFLEDQLDLKSVLAQNLHAEPKAAPYVLNPARSYFGATKSFPSNVVIQAKQDWTSEDQHIADVLADPRHLQMRVVYNIADVTPSADYRPRLADDRVGIYDDIYLQYADDAVLTRKLRYVVRWNLSPSDPSQRVSRAKHPMVFYLSDTIPQRYRAAIRAAVLRWNDAFLRIGIGDALQVRDQPSDPAWDPDDIRYNVLRWVTEYEPSFGANSQTLYDPRTGEEFRTGILISADVPLFAERTWHHIVDPARYGRSTDPMPQKFLDDAWLSVIMHETGHNLGMQHNFIGSQAYSARDLRDPNFTSRYGITSTVMEYAPVNVWPRPMAQGDYFQTVLGPYDYYAMHWTYAAIPGAASAEAEVPTLQTWASAWSDPRYRYASDEDVSWANGHASDPRSEQGDLTDDPLSWCATQLRMERGLVAQLNARYPQRGDAFENETDAFHTIFNEYRTCATMPAHYIGGQYVSRAHRGDPGSQAPIVPVSKAEQRHAFGVLATALFASNPLRVSPTILSHLGYSEWAGYGYVGYPGYGNLPRWAYAPPERHDLPLAEETAALQDTVLKQMFAPIVLARIADAAAETTAGEPMRLADLFDWMHAATFSELERTPVAQVDSERRSLQQRYTALLAALYVTPQPGTPEDARALARADLARIEREATRALTAPSMDRMTRAHLELLRARAQGALRSGRYAIRSRRPSARAEA